jgi:hypothetical protein
MFSSREAKPRRVDCGKQANQSSVNGKPPSPDSSSKQRARLRIAGISVLLLGIGSACIVYWLGTRSANLSDDLSMERDNIAASRQMGILFGNMGTMIEDLSADLKRLGMQAILIAAVATLVALGCFYLARFSDDDGAAR